ncbi:nickel pincer cofactor biosynthesis protein LarC [Desertimonas flava]|uniref:nickel pincer cofactor biosynthesis protein LarC n=1 Tax=Desertimonas flava TaxID=2064846 RepID=UPI000E34ED9F|nr:nickel pincer cofactor biosynthesis protein LarC [Desertimonas flava]
MTGRVLYVQCSAGVAGDMLLGALVDAGADRIEIMDTLGRLDVDGYAVTFERVQRGGVAATWANVVVDHVGHDHRHDTQDHGHDHTHDHDHGDHPHRPASTIRKLLEASDLPGPVRDTARRVFAVLAEAEGAVHGIAPDDVEFHEVGAVDAIVDVVGIAAALHSLGVELIVAGPVATGRGTIRAAHGALPNPPPAVARLLASRQMPAFGVDTDMELATPTGVAVLAALADGFGAMPAMAVDSVGYGAGTADPPGRPNVVQVLVGRPAGQSLTPAPGQQAALVEVNVDDVTGEVLAHTISRLLDAGAFDAWATPIVMKKGRPAHTVSALCDPARVEAIAAVLLAETGSLGVRASTVTRWPQRREHATVVVDGQSISVKVGAGRVKVEHDDAAAAAAALGRPLRDVIAAAERAASERAASERVAADVHPLEY